MSSLVIRFVSRNQHKLREASEILALANVKVRPLEVTIEELQTENTERLVKDKAMRAFKQVGRPLFVEHTGLYIKHLHDLPGGLTQIFWDRLQADRFCDFLGNTPDPRAIAKTIIGYTDAKRFFQFSGEISGRIAPKPAGPRGFQWDCAFIPEGHHQTFAQMGDRKHDISMRRIALDRLSKSLRAGAPT